MQPHQQQPRPSYGAPSGQATVYGAPNLAQYGQPMAGQAPSQVSYGGHSMQPSIVSPQSYGSHPQQPTGQVSYGGALPVSAQQSAGQVSYGSTSQISAQQPLQSARPMSPPSGQPQQAAYYSSGQYSGYGHVAPMAYGSPHQAPSANVASPPLPSQARPPLPSSQQMYQGAQPVPPIPSMPPMPQSVSPRQMYQQPTAPPAPKVSPAQMPNVVAVQEADEARHSEGDAIFRSSVVSDILPPLPTTSQVTILDDGNCSPRFMRSTLYHVPNTEDLLTSARLPLSIIIQPFAKTSNHLPPIPVVDFGPEHGPLRCTRCRAYINPFVKFLRGGRSFECNICSMVNDVPDSYFCNLDATGRRTDLAQRPELVQGTVDFVASKEYIMRKPEPPYLLFMVDASRSAVQNGAFMSALIAIREIIEQHLCGDQKYHRMAIITFDKNIGVYDLRASEAQILVMSDIHEPFVPLHDGLFFDPLVAYEQAFALLDRLPSLFMETRIVDSCAGAAAAFAVEALKGHGGRAILFSTTLPNVGVGLLRNRDASAPTNADKVNPLVLPHGDFFSKLGLQASSYGVSFVIVSTPAGYIDMATLGQLVSETSGHVLHYSKFMSDLHGRSLVEDLKKFLLKPFVYDSVLRARAGSLLQTAEYLGNCSTLNQTDYQFSALDCDQSFAVTFAYDGKLPENEPVTFQCAILHTTSDGHRRIRVHNLSLTVTSLIANVFRMADLDALLQFTCKKSISQIRTIPIPTLVSNFHIRSAQALGSYRKFCANTMPQGQLVLPESLKLLPIYCLAFSKSSAFCSSVTQIDCRMAAVINLTSMSLLELPVYLYPKLYPVHRLMELSPDQIYPSKVRLSAELLEPHGLYLLDNGGQLLLWVGSVADPEVLSKVFGVAQATAISTSPNDLPELPNAASQHARTLIQTIRAGYEKHLPLTIVRNSLDPTEVRWQNNMVEDAQSSLGPSYVDFLCRLHNQINHEMTSASLAERTALLSFLQ